MLCRARLYDAAHPDSRRRLCLYREEDAGFNFGRVPDLARLAEAIERHPLIGVIGSSGRGKSSLVRARSVPQLRCQTGERVWQLADLWYPAPDPLSPWRALLPLCEPKRILDWSRGDIADECAWQSV